MIFNPIRYTNSITTGKEIFTIPTQGSAITYNGGSQSPSWNNYNTSHITITGQTSGTNAGTYTVTFSLIDKENTLWSDYTSSDKEVTWAIERATIATVPTQSGTLTYTGSAQSPVWINYNSSKLSSGGITSSVNAGTYIATFTPTSNYQWSDGTRTSKNVNWTIGKAQQNISVSTTYVSITEYPWVSNITVSGFKTRLYWNYDASFLTVLGENDSTLSITALKSGTSTVKVYCNGNTNYYDSNQVTITVTATVNGGTITPPTDIPTDLNDATWGQISQLRSDGDLFNYYSIGDTKNVTLNGSIGNNFNLNNFNIDVFLVDDANHAIFQFGKINDILTAFYNSTDFPMNNPNPNTLVTTNSGGWASSDMRLNILCSNKSWNERLQNTFLSLIPEELGSYINMAYNYTENSTTVQTSVTGTYDSLYLPSEFEIFGVCKYSYPQEASYQHQFKYYKLGNSKIFHQHSNLNSEVFDVWTRSRTLKTESTDTMSPSISQSFCCVHYDGTSSTMIASVSCGISPCFNI